MALKYPTILNLLVLLALSVEADTCWTLTSGEIFYGEPVSQDAKNSVIKTRYGVLTFPNSEIAKVAVNTPPPGAATPKMEKSEEVAAGKIDTGKDLQKQEAISSQMPTFSQSISGEPEQYLINVDSWTGDYKDFVK